MKNKLLLLLLSLSSSFLVVANSTLPNLSTNYSLQSYLQTVDRYLAHPYVALPPVATEASAFAGEEPVRILDMRGNPNFPQPEVISICGLPDTIPLLLFTKSETPILDLELALDFDEGLEFAGFAYVNSGNAVLDTINVDNPASPTFRIDEISLAGGSVVVYVGVRASCSFNELSSPSISFDVDYVSGGVACTTTLTPSTPYSASVLQPEIAFDNTASSVNITDAMGTFCSNVDIIQTTTGAAAQGASITLTNPNDSIDVDLVDVQVGGVSVPAADIVNNGDGTLTITIDNEANPAYFGADGLMAGETAPLSFCYMGPEACFSPVRVDASIVFACQGELCQGTPDTEGFTISNTFNFNAEWEITNITVVQQPAACGLDGDPDNYILEFELSSLFGDYRADLYDLNISIDSCVSLTPDTMYLAGANPGPLTSNFSSNDGRTTLNLNNAGIATDPDGAGVGLEDLDGDGRFDDVAGDQVLVIRAEFSSEVAESCVASITPPICNFTDIIVTGKVDCRRDNQTFMETIPGDNNFLPSTAVTGGDTTTYMVDDLPVTGGFDFGTVGEGSSTTLNIVHEYDLNASDISCAVLSNRFIYVRMISDNGPVPLLDAEVLNITNATFVSETLSSDSSFVTWILDVDDNTLNMNNITFDIAMDSTYCNVPGGGEPFTGIIDVFTIDECDGCSGMPIFRACTSNPYTVTTTAAGCPDPGPGAPAGCTTEASITLSRVSTGYTDRTLATEVTPEEAAAVNVGQQVADPATSLQIIPGDTIAMTMKVVVTEPDVWNDSDYFRFRMEDRTNRSQINNLWDKAAARLTNFSVLRTDGTTVDLGGVSDGGPPSDDYVVGRENGNRFLGTSQNIINPGLSHSSWNYRVLNSVNDSRDGLQLDLLVQNSSDGSRTHMDQIYAALGGEFMLGDTINIEFWVPIMRLPRTSGVNFTDIPRSDYSSMLSGFRPDVVSNAYNDDGDFTGNKALLDNSCRFSATYTFHEPTAKSDVRIEYMDDNGEGCDAQIVIDYTIDDVSTLAAANAYLAEYRPTLGIEEFTADIPASYYLDPTAVTYELLNTPFSGSVNIDQSTSGSITTAGSTFLYSSPNTTTITFRDAELDDGTNWLDYADEFAAGIDVTQIGGELPLLGVGGDAYADPDTLRIIIPIKRLCPDDPTAPLSLNSTISHPYLPDYSSDPWLCTNNQRWFETATVPGACPDPFSFPFNRGDAGNAHRYQLSSLYTVVDNPDPFVPPTTSVMLPNLMDTDPGSESNTYIFMANDDIAGGKLYIDVSNSISLLAITGDETVFTQVAANATTTTYEVDMGALSTGDDFTINLETELLFCEVAGVTIRAFTGCVTDESAAIVANAGINCVTSNSYSYLAGETGLDVNLDYPGSQIGCSTETFTLEYVNTGTSSLFDFAPTIYLPEGFNFVPGTFIVAVGGAPEGIGSPVEDAALTGVSGTAYNWPAAFFDNASFGTDEVLVGETVSITFMAEATCDFTSGGAISTSLSVSNVCDEPSTTDIETGGPISIVPPDTPLPEFDIELSDTRVFCGEAIEPITLTLLNTSGLISQTEICLTLPPGVTLTEMDVEPIAPLGYMPVINPSVPVGTGGATQLCIDGPMNLQIGEFICLNLSPAVSLDCGEVEIGLDVSSTVSITCGAMTCDVAAVVASSNFNLEVIPSLAVNEADLIANCNATDGMLDIEIEAMLENLGADDFTGNVELSLFSDIDMDGELDDFETQLAGPTSLPTSLVSGAMSTITSSFTIDATDACPLLLQIVIPGCDCSELIVPFDEVTIPLAAELGDFLTLCPGTPYTTTAEICGDVSLTFDPIAAGAVTDNGDGSFDLTLNDGFGIDAFVPLVLTSNIGNCNNADTIYVSQLETFEFEDETVSVCGEGCQTISLGIDPALRYGLEVEISPSLFITDPTALDPEICDPVSSTNYDVEYTLNGQCVTNSTLMVTVVLPPTLTITTGTACRTGFAMADFVTVSPVDLGVTFSSSGTGTFSPSPQLSDSPTYTPSAADIEAGEVLITARTDNPDGPCAGLVVRETFTILLVDCGTFPWGGN